MRRTEAQKKYKLMRILTMPARLIRRVQDFYVHSVTEASRMRITPSGRVSELRRNFSDVSTGSSGNCDGEDYRELVRAASVRSLGQPETQIKESKRLPKSGSVALRRIDEDKSLDVGDTEEWTVKKKVDSLYPRSGSSAFSDRTGGLV